MPKTKRSNLTTATALAASAILTLFVILLVPVFQARASSMNTQQDLSGQMMFMNDNNTVASSNQSLTNDMNTSLSPAASIADMTSANKTFYIFNQEIEGLNETTAGIPADAYSIPVIVVNKGDNVTINFYNTEAEAGDNHSFTLGAPYNIDQTAMPGQHVNATFVADHEGVFIYYCKFHQPTMRGELVVLPKSMDLSSSMSLQNNNTTTITSSLNSTERGSDDSNMTTFEQQAKLGVP
jgi:plastocyanin